ncbi:AAA family ATPase [Halobacteriota archaeon]
MKNGNPFSPTFPVNPNYFANREEILSSFRTAFDRSIKTEMPTPDNIAILGNCGTGKTSVLRKFEAIALEEFKDRKVFSAIVEFTPANCNSFSSIFGKVVEDISGNFITNTTVSTEIKNEIKNWRVESIKEWRMDSGQKSKDEPSLVVAKDMFIALWEILEKLGVDTTLLMLDDLHHATNKYPDVLKYMKTVFQGLAKHGCNFMVVITGKRGLFSDVRMFDGPFANFFNIRHSLNPFNLNGVRDAISKPLKLSGLDLTVKDEVIEKIHHLTKGYPIFINFVMRELVSLKEHGRIDLRFLEKNYDVIERIMEKEAFKEDFLRASHKEREILLSMAKLSERFKPSDINIANARTQLRFLLKKGLILRHDRGEYSLYHPLFREYLGGMGKK